MSGRDDDDRWEDLLRQVEEELEEDGELDPELREAIAEGLRQVLEELPELLGLDDDERDPVAGVRVTVVEGGRSDHDPPPADRPRPDLRVAEAPADDEDDDEPDRPVATRVRVLRPRAADGSRGLVGRIRCAPGDAPQLLYRGPEPRCTRVACTAGALRLHVDGAPAERLGPGQSADVVARHLAVSAEGDGVARGRYAAVPEETR